MNDKIEDYQKGLEHFILLLLGALDREISLLHLEKESFLLWNFHPSIKKYMNFIKYYRGPFSKEIEEAVKNPQILQNHWHYKYPKRNDYLSGGYIRISPIGLEKYHMLVKEIEEYSKESEDVQLLYLLSGIKMVRRLYDALTMEELLLLIYEVYEKYTEKSNVYKEIESKKEKLTLNLFRKGIIDQEKYKELIASD